VTDGVRGARSFWWFDPTSVTSALQIPRYLKN
jgi:hypothetical protein